MRTFSSCSDHGLVGSFLCDSKLELMAEMLIDPSATPPPCLMIPTVRISELMYGAFS